MTIRVRILSVILLMSWLIIVIGVGVGLVFTRENLIRSIQNDLSVVANTVDRFLNTEINLQKADTALAAQYVMEASGENLHQVLEQQVKNYKDIMTLTVMEPDRIVDYAGLPQFNEEFIDTEYIRRAFSGEQVISTSRIYPDHNTLLFHVCVPMEMDGSSAKRILIATIDGMFFSKVLAGLNIWKSGYIFIVDGSGYTLAHPDQEVVKERINYIEEAITDSRYKDTAELISKMIRGETGAGSYSFEGVKNFCAFMPITGSLSGWSLGVVAPADESPLKDSFNGLMLVGLVCFLLSTAAASSVSIILEKPYLRASGMVVKLEQKDAMLSTMNDTATILLESKPDQFDDNFTECMGMMARCIDADNVKILKNFTEGGKLCCSRIYNWAKEGEFLLDSCYNLPRKFH